MFTRTIPYANLLDPTRYIETRIGVNEKVTLTFSELKQEMPFEVQFTRGSKATFFDLDEVPEDLIPESAQKRIQNPSITDRLLQLYWTKLRNRTDFKYSTRGIRRDVDQELMFVGGLEVQNQRILMKNPRIVLGSDRMELYEFMARRKEVWAD